MDLDLNMDLKINVFGLGYQILNGLGLGSQNKWFGLGFVFWHGLDWILDQIIFGLGFKFSKGFESKSVQL